MKKVEANITKVTVNGGVKAPASGYTDGNLQLAWGGDNNNTYDLKLNKDLDLTDGSIKFGDNTVINKTQFLIGTSDGNTTITSDGIVISKNGKNDIQITQSNISMGGNIIHDVDAGVVDTDAVNVSQLKKATEGNRTKFTIEGGVVAGANGTYTGSNLLLTQGKESEGNYTYDLKLADQIKIGGGSGQDGNITVADKNGNSGVSITTTNGVGAINIVNSGDNSSATISVKKVIPSAQGENGTTDTRITYNTGSGGTETLATLNDGLKFAGDINQNNQPINKNLNDTLNITGGVTDSAKLTNNNIGVVNDGSDLIVKLAKDINLGQDGSVTIGNTVINNSGLTIGSGSNTIKITDNNISMGGQQIHDVAAGTADTDAVNVGQLNNAVNNAVTNINNNITDINNTIGDISNLKTYDVQNQTGNQATSVVEAINRMNDQGIKFFHTNDGQNNQQGNTSGSTDDASASGKYSTAIGYRANAGGENSLAMGNGATVGAGATNSIAIGTGSNVTGLNSIAIGTGHQVSGSNSGAFGNPSYIDADNSYGIGNNNRIENTATQSFAIGNSNTISTANTYVLGSGVTSTVENSLFFGNNAAYINEITDPDKSKGRNSAYTNDTITVQNANGQNIDVVMNFAGGNQVVGVVSVGNANETRRIQGVAPGLVSKDSTDAINGSQLYSAIEGVSAHIGNQINQTNQAVNNLAQQLGDARKEARSGTASAIAIGNLPQSTMPGKGMLSVGTGYYKDEGALSLGLSKMSDNGKWIFKSSLSYDTQENVGAGLSLGFHF